MKYLFTLALIVALVGIVSADTRICYENVDGVLYQNTDGSWATLRGGAGEDVVTNYDYIMGGYLYSATNATEWYDFYRRGAVTYNTTLVASTDTINSVKLSAYGYQRDNYLGSADASVVYFTPASDSIFSAGDYDATNLTRVANDITWANWVDSGWCNWTMNTLGINSVVKGGYTHYMLTLSWDPDGGTPTYRSGGYYTKYWYRGLGYSSGTLKSYLTIDYTPAAGGDTTPPASITGLDNSTTCNSVNFTWTNPAGDSTFNGTQYWLNGTLQNPNLTNTTTFKLVSGLTEGLSVQFASKTFDNVSNINATFQNMTAITKTSATASFTKNATSGLLPFSVLVNDTSTGTSLSSWNWSWGDSTWTNTTTSASRNSTHTYGSGGTYNIFLITSNTCGSNQSASQAVTVGNQTISGFTANVTQGLTGLPVLFSVSTSTDNATFWNWSFGNGGGWQNGSTQNGTHVYGTGGLFTVIEIAGNAYSTNTTTKTSYISIYNQTSSPAIAPSPASGLINTGISLTPSGVNATKYNWFFPNGTSILNTTSAAITFVGSTGGSYSVRLNTTNEGYGGSQVNSTVNVYNQTTATITPSTANGLIGNAITLTPSGVNATLYSWYFPNGSSIINTTSAAISFVGYTGGVHSVRLTTTDTGWGSNSVNATVNVYNQTSSPGIAPSPASGLLNTAIQLTPSGVNATKYNWYFPNGTSILNTTSAPIYVVFPTGGVYSVRLNVTNEGWGMSSVNDTINVGNTTLSGFTANVTSGFSALPVGFTATNSNDNATFWNWSFGDGIWQNGSTQNSTHLYSTGGLFTVIEIAGNSFTTNTTTRSEYIDVWNHTTNDFSANATFGYIPMSVLFTDTSYNATSWYWMFGDGNTSTSQSPTFTYNIPGVYSVNHSSSNTHETYWTNKSNYITASANAVNASFSGTPLSGLQPLSVTFTDLSSNTTAWNWSFGDGSLSTEQNPTHVYNTGGLYTVALNASNQYAYDFETKTGYVDAWNRTYAAFSANETVGDAPMSVLFSDGSSNATGWSWDVNGDGVADYTTQNPVHTYTTAGTYTVNLTATNAHDTDFERKVNYITVNEPADVTPPASITGLAGTVDSCSQITWNWNNPGGDYALLMVYRNGVFLHNITSPANEDVWNLLGESTSYQFAARTVDTTGNLNVTWVNSTSATDECAPTSFPPVAAFHADDTTVCINTNVHFTDDSTNSPSVHHWYFGDGGISEEPNPAHAYDSVGSYEVDLWVYNGDGNDWENKTGYIAVSDCTPPASVENLANTTTGCDSITWAWDNPADADYARLVTYRNGVFFGYVNFPLETVDWTGLSELTTYDISTHTEDTTGNINTTWRNASSTTTECPLLEPIANFTSNSTCGNIPYAVQFTDTSTGSLITDWYWDFGDGNTSTDENPINTYGAAGAYQVNHSVTNLAGTSWKNVSHYLTAVPDWGTCTGETPVTSVGGGGSYGGGEAVGAAFGLIGGLVGSLLFARKWREENR